MGVDGWLTHASTHTSTHPSTWVFYYTSTGALLGILFESMDPVFHCRIRPVPVHCKSFRFILGLFWFNFPGLFCIEWLRCN